MPGPSMRCARLPPRRHTRRRSGMPTVVGFRSTSLLQSGDEPFELTAVLVDLTDVKEQERRSRRVLQDRDRLSQAVQTALLPSVPSVPDDRGLPVVAAYQPGDDRLALGGDFYDVVLRPDGDLALLVGDVCGHGPEAAATGAACRIGWRTAILSGADLPTAAAMTDRVLRSERADVSVFATIISAVYNATTHEVTLLGAGHPPPVLLDFAVGHRTL